jgi:hypothetical protein
VSALSSGQRDRPPPLSPEGQQRARGRRRAWPVPPTPRGRSCRSGFGWSRRPGSVGGGDGTAAGPARTLAHPRGEDVGPPVGVIHVFTPGPQGLGLDVEPSLITNFKGFTAFTLLAGQAEDSDGKTYDVHSDLRVMAGEYVAEDSSHHQGTFAFF